LWEGGAGEGAEEEGKEGEGAEEEGEEGWVGDASTKIEQPTRSLDRHVFRSGSSGGKIERSGLGAADS
jgi:hypothetical protein